jgi:tRNA threonylcarbamoyl adenosine modification protein YeaZ/ribosomal-protein-alanine acetyltransferase
MVVLALETISRAGSVALWRDGTCASLVGDPGRSHAERLPGELTGLLDAHGLSTRDVSLLGVVTGPGSFTGLRVGVATVQGLAMAGRIQAIGVPTLDALLTTWRLDREETVPLVACLDGQRGEVFLTAIEARAGLPLSACRVLVPPMVATPEEAAGRIADAVDPETRVVMVGDGAVKYQQTFAAALPGAEIGPAPRPLAEAAAALSVERAAEAGAPHALRAVYIRRPDVVIARERRSRWTIRRASGQADLGAVAQLQHRVFTNPWNAESIRWELENTDVARLYLLSDENGAVVAFCACWIVADELHINSIAVDPDYRRQGLGRMLVTHVLSEASSAGAQAATLEVRASNAPARALYESLGFRAEGTRRDYYREPREDALILWNRRLS